jgi:RND family efflux transporter MFP subunit
MKFCLNVIGLPAAIVGVLLAVFPLSAGADSLEGITVPNADVTLSFVVPGRITDILVKEGQQVKKDQLLVRLYDEPERIQSQQLKLLADNPTKIDAARAELAQKTVDLKKVELARAKGAASEWEVEHLQLNVRIAELSLQSALVEQEQYRRRYAHSRSQLQRMRLAAPIAGRIENVSVEVGESVGSLSPVIRIVQNDPLWIDVPVPMAQAGELTPGQHAWIVFPGDTAGKPASGHIINIAAVGDAASDTLRVRIEVPNPLARPAGERVAVSFSADGESTNPGPTEEKKKNTLTQHP